jgi:ferredoxin
VKARVSLLLPYACALLIIGLIAFDGGLAHFGWGAERPAGSCHAALAAGGATGGHGVGLSGLPDWLYYSSIAAILVLSFGIIEWRADRATESAPRRPRVDLFVSRWLRAVIASPTTRFVSQLLIVGSFLLIIVAGLFGNQLPTKNIAPLLTWTVWWCGLILLILYAGKAWCYVCPWDAIAGWAEGLRLRGTRRTTLSLGIPWPRVFRNIWPATILFIALTWVELGFGVTMRPRATAWLGLGMLGLAFASAFVFDRKSFCRYGCLVGRISGLYALFSPVEVRARDRDVCRTCATRSCYRGNADGDGCPTFQYLGAMDQNTYCISCMECVRTCEADNVALSLRPWGEDLFRHRKPRSDEAYLALLMLSLTGFHGLTMTPAWGSVVDAGRAMMGIGQAAAFTIGMVVIMVAPVLLYAALVGVSRVAAGATPSGYSNHFVAYAYALLPIALFYHLAHNSEHLLMEGQRVVALMSDPFGWEWDLFGTATWTLQPLVSLQTLWSIQVVLVVVGHIYSLWAARRAAASLFPDTRSAVRSQVPMLAAMVMFSIMSMWLLKQPMEMRMSWM